MRSLEQCVQTAQAKIDDAMQRHERAILAFSGGKDSLAVLRLLYPYRDRVTVATVDTGAIFPHMVEFIREATKDYSLHVIRTNQAEYWRVHGIPSRIVPLYNHPQVGFIQHAHGERILINDWLGCHQSLVNQPMNDYVQNSGASLFIMGQRDDEGYMEQPKTNGAAEVFLPISEWTGAIVFEYLASIGVKPPKHYQEGIRTSLDCWNCPAEATEQVVRFIKREHPERVPELQHCLYATYSTVADALRKEIPTLREAGVLEALNSRLVGT